MRNFKKTLLTLVALLLAFAMCFAIAGCDKDDDKKSRKDKDDKKTSVSDKTEDEIDDKTDNKTEDKADEDDMIELVEGIVDEMYYDHNADIIIDTQHPEVVEYYVDQKGYTEADYRDETQDVFDAFFKGFDENYEPTWEIGEPEELTDEDYEELEELFLDALDISIEDAKIVRVLTTCMVNGVEQDYEDNFRMVMIDGEWYLYDFV